METLKIINQRTNQDGKLAVLYELDNETHEATIEDCANLELWTIRNEVMRWHDAHFSAQYMAPDVYHKSSELADMWDCSRWTITKYARKGLLKKRNAVDGNGFAFAPYHWVSVEDMRNADIRIDVLERAVALAQKEAGTDAETIEEAPAPTEAPAAKPRLQDPLLSMAPIRALFEIVRNGRHRIAKFELLKVLNFKGERLAMYRVKSEPFRTSGGDQVVQVDLMIPDVHRGDGLAAREIARAFIVRLILDSLENSPRWQVTGEERREVLRIDTQRLVDAWIEATPG
jgi:hypothetical protein